MDLENVIADALTDAVTEPFADTTPEPTAEPTVEAPETTVEATPEVFEATPTLSDEEAFNKEYGLPAPIGGRENRIPQTRVKAMVDTAKTKAREAAVRELESTYKPKLDEYTAKVTDYESRLTKVAEFERILESDPNTFLGMLAKLPAYKEFFEYIGKVAAPAEPAPNDGMPQPNQELSDGTKVYDEAGLKALMDWQSAQVEQRLSSRYAPIENEWKAKQQLEVIVPQIQAQITEARTWPAFTDNEEDIVKALQSDQRLSLEAAYRKVVLPKLTTNKDTIRQQVIAELKAKPTGNTSAPANPSRPKSEAQGPRSLEQIIADSVAHLQK